MAELVPVALSLHQRDTGLDVRERLAEGLASHPTSRDRVVVASCHRVEVYAALSADFREDDLRRMAGAPDDLARAHCAVGEEAVRHLFRVAAGLDSVLVGEGQIARQIKRVHEQARAVGLEPMLDRLFRSALALARDLRGMVGSNGRSVGSLAVDEALAHVADPTVATALVIGAGEIGKLSARALSRRVGGLVIANRDIERARALAGGIGARAVALDALEPELDRADVVISAADTRGSLLTRGLLAPRCARRPLVVVDIAVPRSVAEDARDLPGLRYRDVDDLAAERAAVSPEVLERAEGRCREEARAFMDDLRAREAAGTIRALRERAETVRRRQLERALRKLGHLPDRDRRVVEGLASSLVGAMVHAPTVTLRVSPERAEAARALFDLTADPEAGA